MALQSKISPSIQPQEEASSGRDLIDVLTQQIDDLLSTCDELQVVNEALTSERTQWLEERRALLAKCDLAEKCIDTAISKLESVIKETERGGN